MPSHDLWCWLIPHSDTWDTRIHMVEEIDKAAGRQAWDNQIHMADKIDKQAVGRQAWDTPNHMVDETGAVDHWRCKGQPWKLDQMNPGETEIIRSRYLC